MGTTSVFDTVDTIQGKLSELKTNNDQRFQNIETKALHGERFEQGIEEISSSLERIENNLSSKLVSSSPSNSSSEGSYEMKNYQGTPSRSKEAFLQYIRRGETSGLEMKGYDTSDNQDTDAGYPVFSSFNAMINQSLKEYSAIRNIAAVQEISSYSYDVLIEDQGGIASWSQEPSSNPVLKKTIKVHELVSQPRATSKILEDASINIEQYMAGKIGESFARAEDSKFLLGDGDNKPLGILSTSSGNTAETIERVRAENSDEITFNDLMNLQESLESFYSNEVALVMHRETESKLRTLQDTNGKYIWSPAASVTERSSILGIPIFTTNYMPTVSAGNSAIVFGNFKKGYQIIDKSGSQILRDPYTEKPFVKFYTLKKSGGGLLDGRALKILQLAG